MEESTLFSTNRKTILDQIVAHPMLAFLILSFALSWIGWTLSDKIDLGLVNGFGVIGSAGPALAAMIVSALLKPKSSDVPARKRWRLFWMIFIMAMAVMVVRRLWVTPAWLVVAATAYESVAYPSILALAVDVLAALVIAFLLSGIYSTRQGVRDLLRSLSLQRQPVRWYWWLVAVGLYPLVFLFGNTLSGWLGQTVTTPIGGNPWFVIALDVLLAFLYLFVGGGGLEEPGWRSFLLPSLQKRYRPLPSSLILAVLWTLWHLPFFWWLGGAVQGGVLDTAFALIVYFLTDIAPSAILFTALFNRTGGSLPLVMVFHASINTTYNMFLPASIFVSILWLLLGVGTMLWMWRSPQTFSPHNEQRQIPG